MVGSPSFFHGRVPRPRQRPIDMTHLAHQTMGDWGLECEVLRIYDERQHSYLARLRAAPTEGEQRLNLSSLKGAAMGIGAFDLVELALDAEIDMDLGLGLTPERLDDLAFGVEEVTVFIARLLAP